MNTNYLVHTLGPQGTNCEAAANHWLGKTPNGGKVVLHPTLEDAVEVACRNPESGVVLACVVYPDLHHLVFRNLSRLRLSDCFVMPTLAMVLASKDGRIPARVASHPAPVDLVSNHDFKIELTTSNSEAARLCSVGQIEGCITTLLAANEYGLKVIEDFGQIPMGFSVHVPY
ncbi:MAG: hypothetical protein ACYC9J_14020 [Sulfuricaulis sp.]